MVALILDTRISLFPFIRLPIPPPSWTARTRPGCAGLPKAFAGLPLRTVRCRVLWDPVGEPEKEGKRRRCGHGPAVMMSSETDCIS